MKIELNPGEKVEISYTDSDGGLLVSYDHDAIRVRDLMVDNDKDTDIVFQSKFGLEGIKENIIQRIVLSLQQMDANSYPEVIVGVGAWSLGHFVPFNNSNDIFKFAMLLQKNIGYIKIPDDFEKDLTKDHAFGENRIADVADYLVEQNFPKMGGPEVMPISISNLRVSEICTHVSQTLGMLVGEFPEKLALNNSTLIIDAMCISHAQLTDIERFRIFVEALTNDGFPQAEIAFSGVSQGEGFRAINHMDINLVASMLKAHDMLLSIK